MKVFKASTQTKIAIPILIPGTNETVMRTTYPAYVAHEGFQAYYFDNANMHKECAVMAINSFCLTLVNILCIIIAGSLFLKIKEIAPEKSLPDTDRFWKHDIKVAREYNRRNTTVGSAGDMAQTVLSEWATVAGIDPRVMQSDEPKARISQLQTLQDILMDAEDDEVFQTVTSKVGNLSGADPIRRFSRAVLPQMSRSSTGEVVYPSTGTYERRPSCLVGNMLQDYERRFSRFDNACYTNSDFSPRSADPAIPSHLQNRRRSSVARSINFSYWPGQVALQRPLSEGDDRGRLSTSRGVPTVREEEDIYSHI
ncbi:laminin subunit beta-2-like [Tropilaelaps mercedesae]|uniref:Laminin subunit beta-2-like n=1 Tax=Tropilaelaps mercedesae TaxID=418985 RepID=A0A1V9X7C6_9ACAR|nr:laminin subunit beta-2-like [Tropilaelaps mercedesae]